MKWEVSEGDLNAALAAVKYSHDPDAARNLIEYFLERFRDGERFNERILIEYLEHAFGLIVDKNWSADHAFGLKLKRGYYPRDDTSERDVEAAAYMILLMRRNWLWQDAKGEAANLLFPYGKGEKAVEVAYKKHKMVLQLLTDEALEAMLPEGTPIISHDMTG